MDRFRRRSRKVQTKWKKTGAIHTTPKANAKRQANKASVAVFVQLIHIPPKPQTPTTRVNKNQIVPILRFALIDRTKSPKLTEVIPVSRLERQNGVIVSR